VSAPVNVQTPAANEQQKSDADKDAIDIQRKLEWFTGILAIVGLMQAFTLIWQAWLLRGTLKEIHTQAGHMERQTKILEDSVAAAQKSADAAFDQIEMMKRRERAQLSIEFAEPEWTFNKKLGGYPIHFQVTLDGSTRAGVVQSNILAYMGQTARTKRTAWRDMGLPRKFTPEISPFEGYTLISTDEGWPETDTDPGKADLVENHNHTVYVDGSIWYRDIFGDHWMLEIDRVWVPNSRDGGKNATGGRWFPFGSGIHDMQRKIEWPKQTQSEKPN
jgi:hypothetical protein